MPSQFGVEPANVQPLLQGIGAISNDMLKERRKKEIKAELTTAFHSDDPMAIPEMLVKYPQAGKGLESAFNYRNTRTKQAVSKGLFPMLSQFEASAQKDGSYLPEDVAKFQQNLVTLGRQVASEGGDPESLGMLTQALEQDPKGALRGLRNVAYMADSEQYKSFYGDATTGYKAREMDIKEETLKIRQMENNARLAEHKITQETNKLKRDELGLNVEDKKNKIKQKKLDLVATGQGAIDGLDQTISTIDRLLSHKGLQPAVGFTSMFPTIAGTSKADFEAELESFDAKLFSSMIKTMKGMGSLSDAEGKKISSAVGAIKKGMSEEAFINNMNIIREGFTNARKRTIASYPEGTFPRNGMPEAPQKSLNKLKANPDKIDDFVEMYGYRPEGY